MPSPFPYGTGYGPNSPVPAPQGPAPANPPPIPGFPANDPAPPWTKPGGPGIKGTIKRLGRFGWAGIGFSIGWEIGVHLFGDPFERDGVITPGHAQSITGYTVCATAPNTNPTIWYDCGRLRKVLHDTTSCFTTTWFLQGTSDCAGLLALTTGWQVTGTPPFIYEEWWGRASNSLVWVMAPTAWSKNPGFVGPPVYIPARTTQPDPGLLPNPFPEISPWAVPQPGTSPIPNVNPWAVPPNAPGPLPSPRPYTAPQPSTQPGVDPAFEPQVWPQPAVRPRPAVRPSPGVTVIPRPGPGHGPTIIIQPPTSPPGVPPPIGGDRPPRPSVPPLVSGGTKHTFDPPPPGTKERKPGGRGALRFAQALMNAVTETADAINALWGALEGNGGWQTRERGRRTSDATKLRDLYRAYDHPDFDLEGWMVDATRNLIIEQAIDAAGGAVGRVNRKASRRMRPHGDLPFGYQFGPAT